MNVRNKRFLRKTALTALLLCCSIIFACSFFCVVGAVDFISSKTAPPDQQQNLTVAGPELASPTSLSAELLSQAPVNPLLPFVLQSANQTAAEVPSPDSPSVLDHVIGNDTANASLLGGATLHDAAPQNETFITNVSPQVNNASLATVQVPQGGSLNGLLTLTVLSYAAAGVVLAVMRYWSFSFKEEGSSSDSRRADEVNVSGEAYRTLETVDYGHTPQWPQSKE
jgi:hypothetical protein